MITDHPKLDAHIATEFAVRRNTSSQQERDKNLTAENNELQSDRTVWKYPIKDFALNDYAVELTVPIDTVPRYAAFDNKDGILCVWAEVTKGAREESRKVFVVGTGYPIPENGTYVGSAQAGPIVIHVYWV